MMIGAAGALKFSGVAEKGDTSWFSLHYWLWGC
jgi:hypothetical protein